MKTWPAPLSSYQKNEKVSCFTLRHPRSCEEVMHRQKIEENKYQTINATWPNAAPPCQDGAQLGRDTSLSKGRAPDTSTRKRTKVGAEKCPSYPDKTDNTQTHANKTKAGVFGHFQAPKSDF